VKATEVTAGLAESNGSLLPGLWRDSLHVTCGLTACTPGSAPGPTLVNEYGKKFTLLLPDNCLSSDAVNIGHRCVVLPRRHCFQWVRLPWTRARVASRIRGVNGPLHLIMAVRWIPWNYSSHDTENLSHPNVIFAKTIKTRVDEIKENCCRHCVNWKGDGSAFVLMTLEKLVRFLQYFCSAVSRNKISTYAWKKHVHLT